MNDRYRNWCFTTYIKPEPDTKDIGFMVYQKERCPTTAREHFQGYVEFKSAKRINGVKQIFSNCGIHLEHRLGSQQQAIDYCTKLDTQVAKPVFFGIRKNQGHRRDLDEIYDDIEEGMTAKEILKRHRGNGLRHINLIRRGLQVFHDLDVIDKEILSRREIDKTGADRYKDDALTIVECINNDSKLDGLP